MDEKPKEAGAASDQVYGLKGATREDLRRVAKYQKGILICLLINLIALGCLFMLPAGLRLFLQLGMLVVGIVQTVFVFLLALKVYNIVLAVFLGILALIPFVALLALFIMSGKATGILRENHVKVGLLGANLSKI